MENVIEDLNPLHILLIFIYKMGEKRGEGSDKQIEFEFTTIEIESEFNFQNENPKTGIEKENFITVLHRLLFQYLNDSSETLDWDQFADIALSYLIAIGFDKQVLKLNPSHSIGINMALMEDGTIETRLNLFDLVSFEGEFEEFQNELREMDKLRTDILLNSVFNKN